MEASKNYKTRHVPLSAFAIELFKTLPRIKGVPYCFVREETQDRWRDPYGPLKDALNDLQWGWVEGFHDFRHFRATQWIIDGMDIRAVQGLMGHRDLATTMRYVHYVSEHAIEAAQKAEERQLARMAAAKAKRATNVQPEVSTVSEGNAKSLCRKEDSNLHALAGTRT